MTPEQFCYWLQGRAELHAPPPTDLEWQSIREHLHLVFNKVTPLTPGDAATEIVEAKTLDLAGKYGEDKAQRWLEEAMKKFDKERSHRRRPVGGVRLC